MPASTAAVMKLTTKVITSGSTGLLPSVASSTFASFIQRLPKTLRA